MNILEQQTKITAPDGKSIYVTLGYPKGKSKGTVLFVHGLASTEYWPPMLLGSWFFRKHGYSYCRLNLYDWRPNARSLASSDLLQHSKDVDTVVKWLRRHKHSRIFAIGHSFGGLTLLRSKTQNFAGISFWDMSSFISHPPKGWLKKDRASGATYLKGGFELLMSARYIKQMLNFPNELALISKIKVPTQICYADGPSAILVDSSKRYYDHLSTKKEIIAVTNASHSFTEEGVATILFNKTLLWFRKQRKI